MNMGMSYRFYCSSNQRYLTLVTKRSYHDHDLLHHCNFSARNAFNSNRRSTFDKHMELATVAADGIDAERDVWQM